MINYRINWIFERPAYGEAILRLRVKWDNSKRIVSFSSGIRIETAKFAVATQRCVRNTTHTKRLIPAAEINRQLDRLEEYVRELFLRYSADNINPSKEQFKHDFLVISGAISSEDQVDLLKYFGKFLEQMSVQNNWSDGTYTIMLSECRVISDYFKTMYEDELTTERLNKFVTDLTKNGNRNSTIEKHIMTIRFFLRWLSNNGLYQGNLHKTYRIKLRKVEDSSRTIIYLTWEELLHLYNMELPTKDMEQVRDVFCFCCFTSLRYSDVKRLQRVDIKSDSIQVVTKKTGNALNIDLNNYAHAILDKYKDMHFPDDKALPVIPIVRNNNLLKQIGKLAGMTSQVKRVYYVGSTRKEQVYEKWQVLSSHCARRTFVVNALYLGIPAEVVMKWTGHSDYKTMRPYVAIVDELKMREMNKFNKDWSAD